MTVSVLNNKAREVKLSMRETECALGIAQGKTMKNIANDLNLSPRTVEFYLNNIKRKFKCQTKSELIEKIVGSNLMREIKSGGQGE